MKNKVFQSLVLSTLLTLSVSSQAGMIKTFVFDDLSMWLSTSAISLNDSLSIEFENTTDFNDVQSSNILGFQYNLIAGITEWYDVADFTYIGNGGDFSDVFALSGSNVVINYTNSHVGWIAALKNNLYAQLAPGQNSHIQTQYYDTEQSSPPYAQALYLETNVSYSSGTAQVPEPSTLAIFALGMIGLASRRFKRQS